LASFFMRRFAAEYGRSVRGFGTAALAAMSEYSWPGNVRELENRVRRAVVMTDGPLLSAADLGLAVSREKPQSLLIREARARAESEVLQRALAQSKKEEKRLGVWRRPPPGSGSPPGQGSPPAPAPTAPYPVRPKPRSGGAAAPVEVTKVSPPDAVAGRTVSPG